MKKILGVGHIMNRNYKMMEVDEVITDTIGNLPDPFTAMVVGRPKNGKTSFVMQVCKRLAGRYKVLYNSTEEGDSKTIQDQLRIHGMQDVAGKFLFGNGLNFDDLCQYLDQRNSAKVVVIDSLDYMKLTLNQFKALVKTYPTKSFVIICWGKRSQREFAEPKDYFAGQIKYMVGAVILVENFVATCRGRYGATDPFKIWPEMAGKARNHGHQTQLFNHD